METTTKALTLILTFCSIAAFSQAKPIATQPQANESFKLNKTLQQLNEDSSCSYTVTITTSCSSPPYTTDLISLSFGDAFGNEMYASILDGIVEQCSTDIIEINAGPCIGQICYLELFRVGSDGWMPETVTINGYDSIPVTFYFNTFVPYGVWYGFDYC